MRSFPLSRPSVRRSLVPLAFLLLHPPAFSGTVSFTNLEVTSPSLFGTE